MKRRSRASKLARSLKPLSPHEDYPFEALLARVTRAISEMGDLDALVKVILAEARRLVRARDVYLLLKEDSQLVLQGGLGLQREETTHVRLPDHWGLEGRAIDQGVPYFAYDAEAEPGYVPIPGRRGRAGALLAVPLRLRNRVIGVAGATRAEVGWFSERESRWLAALAHMAAVAIENERLRAAEQAQARLRAREEFLAAVSHELKTPVAVIKAYVEVLLRRAADREAPEADLEVLQNVHDQADRMLAMIEELLDFQRLEMGQLRLELSRFDLCALAQRVVRGLQLTATTHRLTCACTVEPLMVVADRKRIEEVLVNLLDNAIKYSPADTDVSVKVGLGPDRGADGSTGDARQEVSIVVSDQGIGIRPEEQHHVFERFYQSNGAPVRGHVGLGLGLYISRQIVECHGGRIWVESTPGQGSRFHVALPTATVSDFD
jgi:signal transduction histidine kinase